MDITVTYISNSGFLIETDEYVFLIDYQGDQPSLVNDSLLEKGKKLIIMASHGHGDHFSQRILNFAGKPGAQLLLSDDIRVGAVAENVDYIAPLQSREVFGLEIEAYGSTDMGVSFMINIGGKRIFHAGDLNYWHWMDESTYEEIDRAREFFERVLGDIKGPVDMAFFPVDPRLGSQYDLGADIFVERFSPRIFFPMHFRNDSFAAFDFAAKHEGPAGEMSKTKIIPLTKAGEKYGGSI
jgi:L-ascorbate metabolism protein UlaG (beta-lactamase superfamily)